MRNLTPPARNDMVDYETAIARRQAESRVILRSYSEAIARAYTNYTDIDTVIALTPMSLEHPSHSDLLRSNYDTLSNGRVLEELAAELHEAAAFHCPMCNFEQSSTLDHFLPRGTFPEFSILARNLIPACFTCNNRKGVQPPSRFVHPYLDRLPELRLIAAATVWEPELHVEYSMTRPEAISDDLFTRLSQQFDILNLVTRFQREAGYVLTEIKLNCERPFRRGGADLVNNELLRQAKDSRASYGVNHYKTALLSALAADNRFCNAGFRDEVMAE